jgi:apolipoprotein N-acyltransferase
MIAIAAAVLSGIMFYLSQGFDNVWILAWLAPLPLLWLTYGRTPTWQVMVASAVAILASVGYLLQVSYTPPLGILVPVLTAYVALFCASVWFARFVQHRATPIATLFAFPACWTAVEFLMEIRSPNGSYGALAYSTVSAPLLIQSASLLGLSAVTFLICLFANTLAMALRPTRAAAVAIGLGSLICAGNVVFGIVRLEQPQPATARVAGIVDQTTAVNAWHAHSLSAAREVTETYASEIRSAAKQGATFVVTSEGDMTSIPGAQSAVLAPLIAASRQTGVQIIAGFNSNTPPADFALSITPDGSVARYDKRHPVPGLENRFTPGQVSGWLGHDRAMEICKDMDFPGTIRPDAARGARLMGVPAGDFGIDRWQHGRMAVMRDVEDGFAMVRAAHDGLIIVSDAQGRLVAAKQDAPTGLTMVVADLPLGPGPTLYTRIGDVFPWLCLIFSVLLGALCGTAARSAAVPRAFSRSSPDPSL